MESSQFSLDFSNAIARWVPGGAGQLARRGLMRDLFFWLQRAGLEKYAGAFRDAAIELDIVEDLTESDLEDLGLPLGDRRRFRKLLESNLPSVAEAKRTTNQSAQRRSQLAERRQLTILFCDLVGWTALSGKYDPEDLRQALAACQSAWEQAIARYEGFLARYLGDGLMAYFGYPNAHEDDAERAILAGLAIVASIQRLQKFIEV